MIIRRATTFTKPVVCQDNFTSGVTTSLDARLTYVENSVPGCGDGHQVPVLMGTGHTSAPSIWVKESSQDREWYLHANASGIGLHVIFELPAIPPGSYIPTVVALVTGVGNTTLPTNLPVIKIGRMSMTAVYSTTWTIIASQVDPSVDAAAFNSTHTIIATPGGSITTEEAYRYALLMEGYSPSGGGTMRFDSFMYYLQKGGV